MNKFLLKSSAALMTALFAASSATFARREFGAFGNDTNFSQAHVQPTHPNPVPGRMYQGVFEEDNVNWSFQDGVLRLDGYDADLMYLISLCEQIPINIVDNIHTIVIGPGVKEIDCEFLDGVPEIRNVRIEPRNTSLTFSTQCFSENCVLSLGPLNVAGQAANWLRIGNLDEFLDNEGFNVDCGTTIEFDPNTSAFDVDGEGIGTAVYRYINGQFITVRAFVEAPEEDINFDNAMSEE